MTRLFELSGLELGRRIRNGDVSSRDVVEAHLARIAALDARLGAVTMVLRDAALAAADQAHRRPAHSPLNGVPFSVKEDIDCLGSPTTHGVPSLRDALPYADAPAVARLKAAGAIPIVRTNLSELGMRLCSSNPLRGRTLNPYDHRITAGGSSCGDAAAVATGMVPFGRPAISEALHEHLLRLCRSAQLDEASNHRLHAERSRLGREWSVFFTEYPVIVGPNWAHPIWPVDADLDPVHGVERLRQTVRFITPGNALGLPSVALPMGCAGGLPTSIQIYADLWREDLCLAAAEVVEARRGPISPIEPEWAH